MENINRKINYCCDRCGSILPMLGEPTTIVNFENDKKYICNKCTDEIYWEITEHKKHIDSLKAYYIEKEPDENGKYEWDSYFNRFYINQRGEYHKLPKWVHNKVKAFLYRTKESAEKDKDLIEKIAKNWNENIKVRVSEIELADYEIGPIDEGDTGDPYYNYPKYIIKAIAKDKENFYEEETSEPSYYDPECKRWFCEITTIKEPLTLTEARYLINKFKEYYNELPIFYFNIEYEIVEYKNGK